MKMKTSDMTESHYKHLGIMVALSFVAMYILMYAMVNSFGDVYANINQAYMAGLMASPMVAIALIVMRAMYHNAKLNRLLIGCSLTVGVALFVFIQRQTAVGDRQFLRSMIPHHIRRHPSRASLRSEPAPEHTAPCRANRRSTADA